MLDEARDRLVGRAAGQHAAVRRRDPPLQQGPAGRAAARRGGGRGDPGRARPRRIRSSRSTARWSAAAACFSSSRFRPTTSRRCCAGRWPTASAAWATIEVRMHDDALEFLAEVSDGDARRALGALEIGVLSSDAAAGRVHPRAGRRVGAAQGGGVRRHGRRALRRHQRADQEHARQRSRRGHLLAGADARSGRGRAVPGPADRDLCQRGRRQCRPAGAAAGRGRDAGLRVRRPARVPVEPGPGGDLPGLRAEVERLDGGAGGGDAGRARGPRCCPCRCICATATTPGQAAGARRRATSTPTTAPDGVAAQDYLGVEREYYRPVDRGFERELAQRLEAIRATLRAAKGQTPSAES